MRKGAFDALNKGSGALEKCSKVVAPSGAPPEELYEEFQGISGYFRVPKESFEAIFKK